MDFDTFVRGDEPVNPKSPCCTVCEASLPMDEEYALFRNGRGVVRICWRCVAKLHEAIC